MITKLLFKHFALLAGSLLSLSVYSNCNKSDIINGSIKDTVIIEGSDSMAKLLKAAAAEFKCFYPNVTIQVGEKGSKHGPIALTAQEAHIAAMSRVMNSDETQAFIDQHKSPPTKFRVAIDPIKIIVNASNPIDSISIQEIDAIFSDELKCGGTATIRRWDDLNIGYSGNINAVRRDSSSGTSGLFAKKAMCKGQYSTAAIELFSFPEMVNSVAQDKLAISYAPMHFKNSKIKAVSLNINGQIVDANARSAVSGRYPLSRTYNLYYNKANQLSSKADTLFLRFLRSRAGHKLIKKSGLIPLT
ncbi:PstS family phosphate ABC transporter substrate-binding protein [Pleionea sp. CnH1-48]|uniref:PstS family phosphate ABC transporter substrate-binding protein n=1 Tax=Pleionea sp. CnH1-48 TaxID=2954494 RepID=UPI0020983614|nr:substrate-binding domain-containing protein [Pleionea sp. CnH1-48]MCO7225889.1 substrate-binding domain-containing protein [Pleionea sp. CnH1-48]